MRPLAKAHLLLDKLELCFLLHQLELLVGGLGEVVLRVTRRLGHASQFAHRNKVQNACMLGRLLQLILGRSWTDKLEVRRNGNRNSIKQTVSQRTFRLSRMVPSTIIELFGT